MTLYLNISLILSLIHVIHSSFVEIPTFNCTSGPFFLENDCVLNNLNIKASNPGFKIIPQDDVLKTKGVHFNESRLEVLTRDICDALPHLRYFYGPQLGLVSVEADAFENCTEMDTLELQDNALKTLPFGLFGSNALLRYVNLDRNHLTEIDKNLFGNKSNLTWLYLKRNQLKNLLFESEMPNLMGLRLSFNQLESIDDMKLLVKKCPKLKYVSLGGNAFSCEAQETLIEILNQKKIVYFGLEPCEWTLQMDENMDKIQDPEEKQKNQNYKTIVTIVILIVAIAVAGCMACQKPLRSYELRDDIEL